MRHPNQIEIDNAFSAKVRLPKLGVGIGYRPAFRAELLLNQSRVDFLEIVADHYLDCSAEKQEELELLRNHFTLIPHAINLSLGSAEGIDERYLDQLARLIDLIDPPWWSEHIAFTRAAGREIGHLTPLPYLPESVEALAANVAKMRTIIGAPLILENISYPFATPARWTEAEFLQRVVQTCDCGLLLDVTNVFANSTNHGGNAMEFFAALPKDRVVQLHLVGGSWRSERFIDDHSSAVPPEIWQLYEYVVSSFEIKGVILERDKNFPPFNELAEELERARQSWRQHKLNAGNLPTTARDAVG